jgi:predicted permease
MGKFLHNLRTDMDDGLKWIAVLFVILVVVLAIVYFVKKRKNSAASSTASVTGGGLGASVGNILSIGGAIADDGDTAEGIMASVVVADPASSSDHSSEPQSEGD